MVAFDGWGGVGGVVTGVGFAAEAGALFITIRDGCNCPQLLWLHKLLSTVCVCSAAFN
jgi:hypothetical protein